MVLTRSFALCCLGGKLKADEVPDSSLIYTVIALQEGGVLSTFEREQAPIEIASQVDASLIRRCWILRCGDH